MRTFIAVELPQDFKDEAGDLIADFKKTGADVKWVEKQNLHLTLKFLGEVKNEQIEKVILEVEASVSATKQFTLDFAGIGTFPNLNRPRVVWLGIISGKEQMGQIATELEDRMVRLGFSRENRSFSPHLTLGRVRTLRNIDKLLKMMECSNFTYAAAVVDHITVMKSDLTPSGPIYTPMKTIPLER